MDRGDPSVRTFARCIWPLQEMVDYQNRDSFVASNAHLNDETLCEDGFSDKVTVRLFLSINLQANLKSQF